MIISLCGCTYSPLSLDDPSESVDTFFAALREDNGEITDSLVYNYASLGFGLDESDASPLQSELYELLRQSREYHIISTEADANKALAQVELTTLDYRKLSSALEEITVERIAELRLEGGAYDDPDSILAVAQELLPELTSDLTPYLTTETFYVELRYDDGHWNLIINDDFYAALTGYAV
ncbi:MAG: hypothetical protein IJC18_00125 [Clostridia bacterium]|nr:hypothetical protein [Clostridia bacterium]